MVLEPELERHLPPRHPRPCAGTAKLSPPTYSLPQFVDTTPSRNQLTYCCRHSYGPLSSRQFLLLSVDNRLRQEPDPLELRSPLSLWHHPQDSSSFSQITPATSGAFASAYFAWPLARRLGRCRSPMRRRRRHCLLRRRAHLNNRYPLQGSLPPAALVQRNLCVHLHRQASFGGPARLDWPALLAVGTPPCLPPHWSAATCSGRAYAAKNVCSENVVS